MSFLFAASEVAQHGHQASVQDHLNYWIIIGLMMTGLYLILSKSNMVKTIIGLNFFQVSVIMFYVSMGRIDYIEDQSTEDVVDDVIYRGTAPILLEKDIPKKSKKKDEGEHSSLQSESSDGLANAQMSPSQVDAFMRSHAHGGAESLRSQEKEKSQPTISPLHSQVSGQTYSNPLPHVLMLTAIVVGVATTALALSLVVRINEEFGTIEEDKLEEQGVMS